MSGIPAAVLEQGSKADSLQKRLNEPEIPAPKAESPPPAEPAKQAEPAKADVPAPKDDGFEHKYNVLKGKYNKEIEELRAMVARQGSIIDQQGATIEHMQKAAPAAESTPAPAQASGPLDPDKYSDYGSEIVELAKTVNLLHAENQRLKQAPAPRENERIERLEKTVQAETQSRFYTELDAACAEWRDLNRDEGFMEWAEEIDPIFRTSRLQVMRQAFQEGDSRGVAAIFNAYKATKATPEKAKQPAKPIMPSDGAGHAPPVATKGENLTAMSAKLKQAQTDFLKGRITEADFDKIAGEYQAALKDSPNR